MLIVKHQCYSSTPLGEAGMDVTWGLFPQREQTPDLSMDGVASVSVLTKQEVTAKQVS